MLPFAVPGGHLLNRVVVDESVQELTKWMKRNLKKRFQKPFHCSYQYLCMIYRWICHCCLRICRCWLRLVTVAGPLGHHHHQRRKSGDESVRIMKWSPATYMIRHLNKYFVIVLILRNG